MWKITGQVQEEILAENTETGEKFRGRGYDYKAMVAKQATPAAVPVVVSPTEPAPVIKPEAVVSIETVTLSRGNSLSLNVADKTTVREKFGG
jgi:hypothetical protein